ncbi:MAG: BatA and WFA domain-containing protein [Clostridiales bacterium]|nr:BatA and WFA domain-containing protein [Clostridiales bacterium]
MGIHALWPLAFLALVPIILLLYFLRQNIKKKEFSAVMLWREVYRSAEATKPRERLRKNLLLILQILTVCLFVLALMRPWMNTGASAGTVTVLVIDNSASMDALYTENETRLEAAKEAACDYVDHLQDDSTLYVVSANQSAVLVLSNSQDKLEAKKRIRAIEQTVLGGDLSSSLSLVQSCISQAEEYQTVFFTDTAFDTGDLDCLVQSFFSEAANCSADSVSYTEREEGLLVLTQVTNYGDEDVAGEVNLYSIDSDGEETLVSISEMEAPAGETVSVYFELAKSDLSENAAALRAELNNADALAGDNSAWCVMEEAKTCRVLLLTESNLFIEKAFANISGVEIYRTADLGVFDTEDSSGYDLYIFDGLLPEELPETGNFLFINCEAGDYFSSADTVENTSLNILSTDITCYSADASFGVNASSVYDLPSWGTAFLMAGEDVAGFYGIYGGHRLAVMGFDLHDTDFGLKAEFPILISEMSDYLLDTGLTEDTTYVAGESILLHGNSTGSDLTITLPDQSTQTIAASEAAGSYMEVSQTGVYQAVQEQGEETVTQNFAVQFPAASESNPESAETMENAESASAVSSNALGTRELRNLIIILLLLLMCAEWIIYVRTS